MFEELLNRVDCSLVILVALHQAKDPQRTHRSVAALQWGKFGPFAEALMQFPGLHTDFSSPVPVVPLFSAGSVWCKLGSTELTGAGARTEVKRIETRAKLTLLRSVHNFSSHMPGRRVIIAWWLCWQNLAASEEAML